MDVARLVQLFAEALAAEFLALGLLYCAYVAAARLLTDAPTILRWIGVAVGAMWLASLEFHLLSTVGGFTLLGCSLAVAVSLALTLYLGTGRRPSAWWQRREARMISNVCRRFSRSPYRAVVFLTGFLAAIVVAHAFVLPPLGWDSLTYHALKAGHWVQHGGFFPLVGSGTWAVYRDYWGGAEVLTAWSMLPFHSDALAMALQAAQWLLLGLAVIALARELGAREPYASSVALLVLSTPTLRMQVGTGYVEVAGLMFLVAGWALGARFLRDPTDGLLVAAGAALGLAAGVKMPFCAISVASLAILLVRAASGPKKTSPVWLAITVCVFAAGIAPWLWYAFQSTGAPLSPLSIRLFGLEIGRSNPELDAYLSRPVPPWTIPSELDRLAETLLRGHENPGATTLIAAFLGVAMMPALLRHRPYVLLLLTVALVTSVAGYYSAGLMVIRHYMPASSVRFALVPLVLGTTVSVASARFDSGWRRYYRWFLLGGAIVNFGLYLFGDVSPRSAAAIGGVLAFAMVASVLFRSRRLALRATAVALFLVATVLIHERMRPELAHMGFVNAPVPPYWLEPSTLVDEPSRARRVAITSGPWLMADNWIAYPFMGRRLQNEVLHVPASDFEAWLAQLGRADATEVMSFSPPSVELRWMEEHPERFRRLAGDPGDWGLFEVNRGGTN